MIPGQGKHGLGPDSQAGDDLKTMFGMWGCTMVTALLAVCAVCFTVWLVWGC